LRARGVHARGVRRLPGGARLGRAARAGDVRQRRRGVRLQARAVPHRSRARRRRRVVEDRAALHGAGRRSAIRADPAVAGAGAARAVDAADEATERTPLAAGDRAVTRDGHLLTLRTGGVALTLNTRRGLSIHALAFTALGDDPLCGTLPHGFYDDIHWGADFYT